MWIDTVCLAFYTVDSYTHNGICVAAIDMKTTWLMSEYTWIYIMRNRYMSNKDYVSMNLSYSISMSS